MRTSRWCADFVLAGAAVALVTPLAGQSTGSQQTPRFRAATDLVTTEVVVRDGRGVFIPGLTIKDFALFEDGVKQTLATFVAVIGGRAMATVAPPPATREGLILPAVTPAESGRVFVIFIDDLHLQPEDTLRARQVLRQIRETLLHDGDLLAMVSTGPSSIEQPLTYDASHTRFDKAVSKVMAAGMTPDQIISANQTSQGPAGLRHNAHVAFRTAYDMVAQVAPIQDRRKAFLYVSSGYDFNPYVNARFKAVQDMYISSSGNSGSGMSADDINRFRNPFEAGGQQFSDMDLIAEVAALSRAAERANVAFYTIDPRGLVAAPPINTNLGVGEWRAHVTTTVSTLRVLAEQTGGKCICEMNDFAGGLREIDNAMSDYYLIGFVSSNPDPMKVKRQIEIKVSRPGVTVAHRREYLIRR